jgi:cyclase
VEYTIIVARMMPENAESVRKIWTESDATGLPALLGVKHRRVYQFHGLYFHLIAAEEGLGSRLADIRANALFADVNQRLQPYIAAYDPDTWQGPRDAMAKEFYAWNA